MAALRGSLLRIASDLPAGDPTRREILAALSKTANWWGVIQVVSRGPDPKMLTLGVVGEDPVTKGGSTGLKYVYDRITGPIATLSEDVKKAMLGLDPKVDHFVSNSPTIGVTSDGKFLHAGYGHTYVFKDAATVEAAKNILRGFRGKAVLKGL